MDPPSAEGMMGGLSLSKESLERASATKAYLEAKLDERRVEQAARRARRAELNRALADPGLTEERRRELEAAFEAREREILREARRRYSVADFEPLVVVGRGAFGEVRQGA